VGPGVGSFGTACGGCAGAGRQAGLVLHLWVGGSVRPNLLLGAELVRWSTPQRDTATALTSLTASVYYYPVERANWFVGGGIGLSNYDNSVVLPALGLGLAVGTGFDIRLTRSVSLTPAVHVLWGTPRDVHTNEQLLLARGLRPDLIDIDVNASVRLGSH